MIEYVSRFFQVDTESSLLIGSYDSRLVVLSIAIAIFASFMGFQVATHSSPYASTNRKHIQMIASGVVLGGGVWSMHFIGMLAFELCTPVTYGLNLSLVSLAPSIASSWVALYIMSQESPSFRKLVISGVLVGLGIGSMHYIGMSSMEMAPLLRYDISIFILSIIVAASFAILSLSIRFGLSNMNRVNLSNTTLNVMASMVMGMAISSMHYTGMAAARFVMPPGMELSNQTNDTSLYLAAIVTAITVTTIFLVLAINLVFKYKDISSAASKNEKRLLATMNTAVDAIITIDSKGIVISINDAAITMLGWQEDELVGFNVNKIVPAPYAEQHDSFITRFLETRDPKIIGKGREVEALTKEGAKIPIGLGIGHVELEREHLFVAFMSDLRQRRKMESTLRENEARFRSLLSNIPGIAYRCLDKPDWPNLFISDAVKDITGYPAKDFTLPDPKRKLADFVHPEDFKRITEVDLYDKDGFKLEYRVIDKFNKTRWVLGYGKHFVEDSNGERYLDGFIMDITHRKEMEKALIIEKEKAEKAASSRAAFLANMSHEIRTPMNSIIGFSDILLDGELLAEQKKDITTINQSAKSLMHILNDVLDSAKLDKGKFQLEYRDFVLTQEVNTVITTFELQAKTKAILLNTAFDANLETYYNGVPDRLRQVLTNIVGNAIKFTEEGSVTVSVYPCNEDNVCFDVTDTGIGMTSSQLVSVFDAFAQADGSMSRRFGGTGLGTTISKQLVELMGGTISATSEIGIGTTFSISLPFLPCSETPVESRMLDEWQLPPMHILVVDDIEQNVDLLTTLLI